MIQSIKDLIKEGTDTQTQPIRLAEIQQKLSGWYAYLSEEYMSLDKEYNAEWLKERESRKSVTETDRVMDMSEVGGERKHIKYQLEAISKVISSIKTRLRVKEEEMRNAV